MYRRHTANPPKKEPEAKSRGGGDETSSLCVYNICIGGTPPTPPEKNQRPRAEEDPRETEETSARPTGETQSSPNVKSAMLATGTASETRHCRARQPAGVRHTHTYVYIYIHCTNIFMYIMSH